jgi:putative radical SAM enzyme (TIGR03279 family)
MTGILVTQLESSSPLYEAGLRAGDRIMAVNGYPIDDELDLRFYAAAPEFRLDVLHRGRVRSLDVTRTAGTALGVKFEPEAIRRCVNFCIFCFIDQMPPGLRSTLYIKDDDLTHSFLNGNYVTLAGARKTDLRKILRLGLSPLFISVHATDLRIRRTMLGNRRAPNIMKQLFFLCGNNIRLHTQIVVCPGYNDGAVLKQTLRDLLSLRNCLLSVAVVPVGLTRFRTFQLQQVDRKIAGEICSMVSLISDLDKKKFGLRRVFLADELLLKAGLPIPPASYYEDYPQSENGVGLVRRLLDSWNRAKRQFCRRPSSSRRTEAEKRYFLATSVSAFPFINGIAQEVGRLCPGITVEASPVPNRFFGESVTVAGLIAAADVLRTIAKAKRGSRIDGVILPAAMFNHAGYTLDGCSAARIGKKSGVTVTVIDAIEELLNL